MHSPDRIPGQTQRSVIYEASRMAVTELAHSIGFFITYG